MNQLVIAAMLLLPASWSVAESGALRVDNGTFTVTGMVPIQRTQSLAKQYFTTTSGAVTYASNAEQTLFLFVNPSTGTKAAYLDNHRFTFIGTNGVAQMTIYRAPVVTSSGTPLGIFPGDTNNGAVSQMQVFKLPVVSSSGTAVFIGGISGGTFPIDLHQTRIFRPGTKYLVTIDNPGANQIDAYDLEWVEEDN